MKGQFFIIAAMVITLSLIMIKGLLGLYSGEETISSESMKMTDKQLENLRNEYEYSAAIAATKTDSNYSLANYLVNFSDFIRNEKDFKALWIALAVNGSNQEYYLIAGNYLQAPVSLNITITDSVPSSIVMNLSDSSVDSYTFNSQINGSLNMTIMYVFEGYQNEDIVNFEVSERNSTSLFLDAILEDGETRVRSKTMYSAKIS